MRQLILIFLVIAAMFFPQPALALKTRLKSAGVTGSYVSYSSAKLSRITNSVNITFINLNKASKVNYELSYTANGIPQGVMGTVTPTGATDSRSLYFGTCSKGVCTAHRNITGAKLTVRTILKNGATNVKIYRIKI